MNYFYSAFFLCAFIFQRSQAVTCTTAGTYLSAGQASPYSCSSWFSSYTYNGGTYDVCCYCDPNKYCPGDDIAYDCGAGKYTISIYSYSYSGITYTYNSGQYATCYPGQYCYLYSSSQAKSSQYCYDCPLGTYRTSGMSQCQTCSTGQYAVSSGATSCLSSCPAGYAEYSYDSTSCPVTYYGYNYYSNNYWGVCYACGKSCYVDSTVDSQYSNCNNGYKLKTQCSSCDYTKVSTGSANTACATCSYPYGAYTDLAKSFNTSAPRKLADQYYASAYYDYETAYFQLEKSMSYDNWDYGYDSKAYSDDYYDLKSFLTSNYYSNYNSYCPGWASGIGSLGNLYSESYDGQSNAIKFAGSSCKTCTAGRYWSEGLCKECLSGFYSNGNGETSCVACPTGKTNERSFSGIIKAYDKDNLKYVYTDPVLAQASCSKSCSWPYTHSLSEGGTSHVACGYFCLCVPKPVLMGILIALGVIVLVCFLTIEVEKGKRDFWLGLNLLRFAVIPIVQVMCSFFYLFTYRYRIRYLSNTGFTVEICFFFAQFLFLAYETLRIKKAYPKFYILAMPEKLFFGEYENVFKVIITTLIALPFIAINLPVLIPQIFLLMLLYSTRLLSIHKVQNWFFNMWTGGKYHHLEKEEFFDVHMFNLSMFTQGIMAVIDLSVQVNNEALSGNFVYRQNLSKFFIFSSVMNCLCFAYWFYRFVYWTLYKRVNPINIPLKVTGHEFTTHRYIYTRMKIKDDDGTLKLMFSHKEKRGGDEECKMQRYVNMYIDDQINRYKNAVKKWTRELWKIKDILDECMAEDVSMLGIKLDQSRGSTELYTAISTADGSEMSSPDHTHIGSETDVVTVAQYLSKIFDDLKDGEEAQEQSLVNEHFIAKVLKYNCDMERMSAAMAVIRVVYRKRQAHLLSKMSLYQRIATLNGYLMHKHDD